MKYILNTYLKGLDLYYGYLESHIILITDQYYYMYSNTILFDYSYRYFKKSDFIQALAAGGGQVCLTEFMSN